MITAHSAGEAGDLNLGRPGPKEIIGLFVFLNQIMYIVYIHMIYIVYIYIYLHTYIYIYMYVYGLFNHEQMKI